MASTERTSDSRVSVCMAVYNGSWWLRPQLSSILAELHPDDEVVVVDDASSDDSVTIVESFEDPRVRIFRHEHNRGYVATFEDALSRASGDVIFLADQDDVWVPGRRQVLTQALVHADVAASELVLLDGGEPLPHPLTGRPWRLRRRRRFVRLHRQLAIWAGVAPYYGCAMAVRRAFLSAVLPFPDFLTESHDLWIATVGNAAGTVADVPVATVRRRLHEANASTSRPRGPRAVLRARVMLVRCTIEAFRRGRAGSTG